MEGKVKQIHQARSWKRKCSMKLSREVEIIVTFLVVIHRAQNRDLNIKKFMKSDYFQVMEIALDIK